MRLDLLSVSAALVAGSIAVSSPSFAADWPQWRGPDRSGVSAETGWGIAPQSEPLWRKELGNGHSSFSVLDGTVYTLGYDVERGVDVVFCFDAESGEEIWRHEYEADVWDTAHDGGTLTTPTIDGDVVYTTNREGKVFCLDRATGEIKWSRDAMADHEVTPHTWGFSASPFVVDGMVIVNYGPVHAFDKETGEDLWHTETNFGYAYSTPAAFEHDGRPLLTVLCGNGCAVVDRTNGQELAFYEWVKNPQIYPMTPVVIDDRIFISAGYDRGCAMLQLSESDDGYTLTPLWESRVMRNKMSGAVLFEDHLYGFDESILKCIDLDGNEMWRKRGFGTGAMSIVGGRLVIITGRGKVVIAEANPAEYVELSAQDVLSAGTYWSTPVLSDGLLYCRNSLGNMACLDFRTDALAMDRDRSDMPAALPTVEELIARHLEEIGGADQLEALQSVHLEGTGERLINTVSTGAVDLSWHHQNGFQLSNDAGFHYGYNPDLGWSVGQGTPVMLDEDALLAAREVGDIKRMLHLESYYSDLETTGSTTFDNRECFVVTAMTAAGGARQLYFEVDSGLYAGHEGDGINMWALSDYQNVADGLALPMRWTSFDSVSGEMDTVTFENASINTELNSDALATPEIIVLLNRSPEEIESANAALTEQYGESLIGAWAFEEGPPGMPPAQITVKNGFLIFVGGPGGESMLTEPDETGTMQMIGSGGITFVIDTADDDESAIEAIRVMGGGEELAVMRRPAD